MRVGDLIDVPDFPFFNQILMRILNKISKGTPIRIKDLIGAPS